MLNEIQRKDLALVNKELAVLANKRSQWNEADNARYGVLKSHERAILAGMTLDELEIDGDNERRAKAGLEPKPKQKFATLSPERQAEVRAFQAFVENRNQVQGNPLSRIGTYTGLGYFTPTGFFGRVFESMKAADVLFNDAFCTQVRTEKGNPITVPLLSDTEHDASVIGESSGATEASEVDIAEPMQAVIGAYSYSSRRWVVSFEALQDMDNAASALSLFEKFTAAALARGIARDLLTGSGSGKTLGLIPSLLAAGAPTVVASGSAANDGSSNTGANSLGTADFSSAYSALDNAYLTSPTCAWLMSPKTLGTQYGQTDKMGRPLIDFVGGAPTILGIPVKLSPSMPAIAATNNSVILGDLSYWMTRIVVPGTAENLGIKQYIEAPGLADAGNVAFRSFVRADGALLWADTNSGATCPFVVIQQHS